MDITGFVPGYDQAPGQFFGYYNDELSEASAAHTDDGVTAYPLKNFGVASTISNAPNVGPNVLHSGGERVGTSRTSGGRMIGVVIGAVMIWTLGAVAALGGEGGF